MSFFFLSLNLQQSNTEDIPGGDFSGRNMMLVAFFFQFKQVLTISALHATPRLLKGKVF